MSKVVAFNLDRGPTAIEPELSIAVNGIDVLYFGRNAPEIRTLGPIEDHPPPKGLTLIGKVKRDRSLKDRAPIRPDVLLHRRFRPDIRMPASTIPTAPKAGVAKNRPLQAGNELKLHSLHGHDDTRA
jgi:hypothetical protein